MCRSIPTAVAFCTLTIMATLAIMTTLYPSASAFSPSSTTYTDIGDVVIDVYFALPQNPEGASKLRSLVLDAADPKSPNYGYTFSKEEIDSLVATDPSTVSKVMAWLDDDRCKANADSIVCSLDIASIDSKLNVRVQKYYIDRARDKFVFFSNEKAYYPPEVLFVDGFFYGIPQVFSQPKSKINAKSSDHDSIKLDTGAVTIETVGRVYGIYPSQTVEGQESSVGVMEYQGNDGFSPSDLTNAQLGNGIPSNPITHIVGDNHAYFPDMESTLDTQVVEWGNSNAQLWYVATNGWMYAWAAMLYNLTEKPEVVSISWGWAEVQQCTIVHCSDSKDYVLRSDQEFAKLAAQRVTIVVASGDAGSPSRVNEGCNNEASKWGPMNINANYPQVSEWATIVSATELLATDAGVYHTIPVCQPSSDSGISCANGSIEYSTNFAEVGWTTGAGFSLFVDRPKWQDRLVEQYLASGVDLPEEKFYNRKGRSGVDVSAFGHNCLIFMEEFGNWSLIDGTSCSSPIFAGVLSRLNAFLKSLGRPVLGFANPFLYTMYEEEPSTFTDIKVGNSTCTEYMCCGQNFGFNAWEGYDVVSGLGSPNVQKMEEYILSKL